YTNAAVQPGTYLDSRSVEITPDGRVISFIANANGVSGATTCVYVWDAQTGTNVLASGDPAGNVATNSTCDWPGIDPSARFVVFLSSASNLVTNALRGDYHIFVRDLQSGTTTLVDSDNDGGGSGVGVASVPQLSADGRFVAFDCADGNQVPNDRNRDSDVFLRDLITGTTELVSGRLPNLASGTANGAIGADPPSLSSDGHLVIFSSGADNLAVGDSNGFRDVFFRDQLTGMTGLASLNTNGLRGNGVSSEGVVRAAGPSVAFTSLADDMVVGNTNMAQDVF